MKKRCYFAYTWDDDDLKLPRFLEILKDKIETYSDGEIEVIFDKKSFELGEDFEKKEDLIFDSDSIVIFFSPSYKEIVDEQDENRGVYREYKKIIKVKEKGIASFIPVIVEGNEKNSITIDFRKRIARTIDINQIFVNGEEKIKQKYVIKVDELVRKIIKDTNLAFKKRDYEFGSIENKMENLFGEASADQKLPNKCMYKTDAYSSVISQHRRYIIGRKGSGKTTFFELLEKYDVEEFEKRFKVLKPIEAEKINMEYAYSVITAFDVDDELFSLSDRLELFWMIYTYISAVYIVCLEEELFKVDDERQAIFKEAGDLFRNEKLVVETLKNNECHKALFISAIETFDNFFRSQLVSYSNLKSYSASLTANCNIENVLKNYFGVSLYVKLKRAISKCNKNIMIALDGFDRVSEHFREKTISLLNSSNKETQQEGIKRLEFESMFYRSMFNVFEEFRKSSNVIMTKVSFCIIIPQDKIDQIKKNDRDFSKYNFASLSWDAIDLLQMLVYRLEFVYGKIDNNDLVDKFEILMKKHFKSIPLVIEIGGKEEIDLFEFILRLSFWRPRDIIKHFYELYLANTRNIKGRDVLSSETIKNILYSKADDIIETEFYAEYRTVITNIEDIMENFRGKDIMLDLDTTYEMLSQQLFITSALRDFDKPINKLTMLYELSVLGIWVERDIKTKENLKSNLCFNYNEGLEPLRILKKKFDKGKVKIVINPVFSRKLSLNYNTKMILENYGWEYLFENHIRKSSIKRV